MIIRPIYKNDFPAIFELIKELALFEKAPDKVTNSVSQMEAEADLFEGFVAETPANEIVGMAIYYFNYFTWVGKSLYLEDLYVKEGYRNQQIASRLLDEVFKVAQETNCNRVRWQVLNWNENAIAFYQKKGATISTEWFNCDFDKQQINDFNIK